MGVSKRRNEISRVVRRRRRRIRRSRLPVRDIRPPHEERRCRPAPSVTPPKTAGCTLLPPPKLHISIEGMEPQAREEARLNRSTIEAGEGPYPTTFGDEIQPPDVLCPAAASTPLAQSLSGGSKRNRTPRPATMPEVERAGQMIDNDEAKEDVGNRRGNVGRSAGLDGDPRAATRMWEIVQVPCTKPSSCHEPASVMAPPPLPSPPPLTLPPPSSPTPAALPEELVEEVLLRFPPKDPTALVRAALVCKRWRCLVSGLGFRRRFSEFHRTAPMLGMFCNREIVRVSQFDHEAYAIDLKSNETKKVYNGSIDTIVPYVSFYTPALEADGRGEGPSAGGSSA